MKAFRLSTQLVIATALFAVATVSFSHPAHAAAANKNAPQGGTVTLDLGGEPPTLHPILSTDVYASDVKAWVMDTLLSRNIETYEWDGRLAEKWEVSKDNKVFTFTLRKDAFFHDGKPVTAEDVKFSFDAIFDPKYKAAHLMPYFENIEKAEVVDPQTVKFYVKSPYFLNFDTIADSMWIIPKHIYSDVEKSKKMNKELIGSGPYSVAKFDQGQKLVLKKFDKWYGSKAEHLKGQFNFGTINLRFIQDETVRLEMMKKGDLDYIDLNAELFVKRTEGPPWGKTALKFKVENKAPQPYGFIGWNLKNDLFADKNVRKALTHLYNREELIKKYAFGMSKPATGPVHYASDYASPKVKPLLFDPKKAKGLLEQAGWKDADKNGILEKEINGKKVEFRFSVILSSKDAEKYLTVLKEDLKKSGIEMEIKLLEWNSFLKQMDDGKFDGAALAWGGTMDWDPKQVWHSSSAVVGGSNFIGYKSPEVDKLIDQARVEMDRKKRMTLLHKVYETIADDCPYLFFFNRMFEFYANSSRLKKPADTFKYGVGVKYWWVEQ